MIFNIIIRIYSKKYYSRDKINIYILQKVNILFMYFKRIIYILICTNIIKLLIIVINSFMNSLSSKLLEI